jgi:hypothetical protein
MSIKSISDKILLFFFLRYDSIFLLHPIYFPPE